MASVRDLDLRGLKCPLPVLRTRKALRALAAGDGLLVTCTDPLSGIDIPNLVREEGDRLERQASDDGIMKFWIVRSPPAEGAARYDPGRRDRGSDGHDAVGERVEGPPTKVAPR